MNGRLVGPLQLIFAVAIVTAPPAASLYGQSPRFAHPAPQRGPLSPYLDLLRVDAGLLPPYHAFVQPQRTVQHRLAQQQQAIELLHAQISQAPVSPSPSPSERTTGGGGRFQTYLHYYNFSPQHP